MNPSLVLWEAVPWSFVVDWLLPVGDFLSSLTALWGISIISNVYTTKSERNWSGWSKYYHQEKPSFSGNFTASQTDKQRVVRPLNWVLPRFQNPLSLSHFANAMSLLATNVGR